MEDNTGKFPDIIEIAPSFPKESVKSFIIDCEAVAVDPESGQLKTFQVLSTRARKVYNVFLERLKISIYQCL